MCAAIGECGKFIGRGRAAAAPPAARRPCSFSLLLRPLLAELVQLRDLLANLLALGFAHALEPHAPFGRQPVERHRHLAMIDDRDVA